VSAEKGMAEVSPLSTGLLLPDAVQRICEEGQALRWDPVDGCYEVIDGELFSQRFDELRRKRDRDDGSNGRPFSRMHKYYKLESGERWAKTGARFTPKNPLLLRNLQAAHLSAPVHSIPQGQPAMRGTSQFLEHTLLDAYQAPDIDRVLDNLPPLSSGMPAQEPCLGNNAYNFLNATETHESLSGNKRQRQDEAGTRNSTSIQSHSGYSLPQQPVAPTVIDGENVKIKLRSKMPYVGETFEVSLQAFLDAIDAGGQYFTAQSVKTQASTTVSGSLSPEDSMTDESSPSMNEDLHSPPDCQVPPQSNFMEPPVQPHDASKMPGTDNGDMAWFWHLPSPLASRELSDNFDPHGNIWSETSKGDQAYFFTRKEGLSPFFNGAVVALKEGFLVPADDLDAEMFLVVSDKNALWKGEPHPTKEQEKLGHWCAYLGQVPLKVKGKAKAGDYLGPVGDGSGLVHVVKPGQHPVVAMALDSKPEENVAVVKAMVSIGLNALSKLQAPRSDDANSFDKLLKKLESASATVALARKEVKEAQLAASKAIDAVEKVESNVSGLQKRMGGLEAEVRDIHEDNRKYQKRKYLWSCFCGLLSLTVTEEKVKPKRSSPARPESISAERIRSCKEVFDDLLTDTIINVALTCFFLGISQQLGWNESLEGVMHGFVEMALHIATLVYLLKPALIVGKYVGTFVLFGEKTACPKDKQCDLNTNMTKVGKMFCPMMMGDKKKLMILFFWYLVAGKIAYTSITRHSTVAPFGYWYMVVLTLKTLYQVAMRQFHTQWDDVPESGKVLPLSLGSSFLDC